MRVNNMTQECTHRELKYVANDPVNMCLFYSCVVCHALLRIHECDILTKDKNQNIYSIQDS